MRRFGMMGWLGYDELDVIGAVKRLEARLINSLGRRVYAFHPPVKTRNEEMQREEQTVILWTLTDEQGSILNRMVEDFENCEEDDVILAQFDDFCRSVREERAGT